MKKDVLSILAQCGLIPVAVLEREESALPLADVYLRTGLPVVEITLRTEAGLPALTRLARQRPDMLVGAGSVLSLSQCKAAVAAGAMFIVSPGLDTDVAEYCLAHGVCFIPGCVTPTEIEAALKLGIRTVKFFPANIYGGAAGAASLYAPFKATGLTFIPTGGINLSNLSDYASASFVTAVGGGWLCAGDVTAMDSGTQVVEVVQASINVLLALEISYGTACAGYTEKRAADPGPLPESRVLRRTPWRTLDLFGISAMDWETAKAGERILLRTNNSARAAFYLQQLGYSLDNVTFVAK